MNKKNKIINVVRMLEGITLLILIVSFLVFIYCIYISINSGKLTEDTQSEYMTEKISSNTQNSEANDITKVIENVNNSIVGISKLKDKGSTVFLKDGVTNLGLGTGFIVTENGYIVTNEHVSGEKFSKCYVTLENGKYYTGNVVWSDTDIDLSIVKIDIGSLEYLRLGDSDELKIAQKVYAIGNPIGFEFQRTVTSGIVSGLDRTLKIEEEKNTYYMEDLIQTDATINPGNSGGPLINEKGEVIGVNSVKITTAEGIGFACPINTIKPIIESYVNNKKYEQATLGIFVYDKNVIPYINQDLGLNLNLDNGVYVAKVVTGSPSEKAGIKEGDIINSIDGKSISKMKELRRLVYSKKIGDVVKVKYIRKGRATEIDIELKSKI